MMKSQEALNVACPAGVEPATYGLEGLANLEKTMLNNGLQLPGSSCSSKQGSLWRQVVSRVGLMVSAGACRENRQI